MVAETGAMRHSGRSVLFGDALLLTTGAFVISVAVALGLQFIVKQLGVSDVVVQAISAISTLVVPVLGAMGAWALHGRPIGWMMAGGFIGGLVGTAVVLVGFTQIVMRVTSPGDEGFPVWAIVLGAVLVLTYLWFAGRAFIDGIRDVRASVPLHRRLDMLRFVSAGLFVALVVAVAVVLVRNPMSEGGEAGIFALVFALVAGLMVLSADLLTARLERRDDGAVAGGAA